MAELVRVEILYAVPLTKLLKIAGRALGVHNIGAVVLGEYISADSFSGLLKAVRAVNRELSPVCCPMARRTARHWNTWSILPAGRGGQFARPLNGSGGPGR